MRNDWVALADAEQVGDRVGIQMRKLGPFLHKFSWFCYELEVWDVNHSLPPTGLQVWSRVGLNWSSAAKKTELNVY